MLLLRHGRFSFEELIANGIEIEATDELGRTAAQIAKLHANEEAHRVIVKYAAAKAAPAMPISSAEEDQLSASLTVLQQSPVILDPSSHETVKSSSNPLGVTMWGDFSKS